MKHTIRLFRVLCLCGLAVFPLRAAALQEIGNLPEQQGQTNPAAPGTVVVTPGTTTTVPNTVVVPSQGTTVVPVPTQPSVQEQTQNQPETVVPVQPAPGQTTVQPAIVEPVVPAQQTDPAKPKQDTPAVQQTVPVPVSPAPVVQVPVPSQNATLPAQNATQPTQQMQLWQLLPLQQEEKPKEPKQTVVPEKPKKEEAKKEEVKPQKPKQEKPKQEKPKAEKPKPEKPAQVKPEQPKPEQVKPEVQKPEKPVQEPPKPEKTKQDKPKPGDPLKIPPEAVKTGSLDFLEGCWQGTRPEYYSQRTIKECFCFGKGGGGGKRYINDFTQGRNCVGSAHARLKGEVLNVTSQGGYCTDGEKWGAAEMVCRGSGQNTPCSWIFTDAEGGRQSKEIPFIRVDSCGR